MAVLLPTFALPASATTNLVSGVCPDIDITITFGLSPTLAGADADYTISASDGPCTIRDLETTTTSFSGQTGSGNGTTLTNCGVLAGIGSWTQTFDSIVPAVEDGTHVISGSWLAATMVVTSHPGDATRFQGVFALRAADPVATFTAWQRCASLTPLPVTSIRMIGYEVWNDPFISE